MNSRLRFERLRRGWSQTKLGDLARIGQRELSAIETGRLRPTEEELDRLSRVLNITPASVLLKPVTVVLEEVPEP